MGKFDIFKHIGSNLEKKIKLEMLYNIDLDIDENGEPFLDVSYNCGKDGKNLFVGLRSAIAALQDSVSPMKSLDIVFTIPKKPVITVLYNPIANNYILEYGKGETVDHKRKDVFVVGYIINPKANFNFEDKINYLYDVMVDNITEKGFVTVNGVALTHPIYKKDCFNQFKGMDESEFDEIAQQNKTLIKETLEAKMGPQKIKK